MTFLRRLLDIHDARKNDVIKTSCKTEMKLLFCGGRLKKNINSYTKPFY